MCISSEKNAACVMRSSLVAGADAQPEASAEVMKSKGTRTALNNPPMFRMRENPKG